jgi:hypothetical protein
VHVEHGQHGEGTVPDEFVLDPYGLAGLAGAVGRQRPQAWMDGLAATDKMRSPGRSRLPW